MRISVHDRCELLFTDYANQCSRCVRIFKEGEKSIAIDKSENDGISVYFLFHKNPGVDNWKLYISSDNKKDTVVQVTENNMIEAL